MTPDPVERFRVLHEKTVSFLMGQIMRATSGKANPTQVKQILLDKLERLDV